MKLLLPVLGLMLATASARGDEAKPQKMPYNAVNLSMKVLKGVKIEGVECIPFYVKTEGKHPPLVPEEASFRIVTWDGEAVPLKCKPVDTIAAADRPEIHGKMVEDGFTHVLWIPKDVKAYLDGDIVHSLPKGAVSMMQGILIQGRVGGKDQP